MPSKPDNCGSVNQDSGRRYFSVGNTTIDSSGTPFILLSPVSGPREVHFFKSGRWQSFEVPGGVTEIFFDANDNLWALGKGLAIYLKDADSFQWRKLWHGASANGCFPRAALNENSLVAYVYSKSCSNNTVSVDRIDLMQLKREFETR
jgi:hypothetical protein